MVSVVTILGPFGLNCLLERPTGRSEGAGEVDCEVRLSGVVVVVVLSSSSACSESACMTLEEGGSIR